MIPDRLLPGRPDWVPGNCALNFVHLPSRSPTTAPDLYAVIIDQGGNRNVTLWLKEPLEAALRRGLDALGVLPDGLLIAKPSDLPNLRTQ